MKFLSATGALIKRRKKTSLAVAIAVLALAAFFVIRATNQQEDPSYDTYTVKAAPALVLQGKVNAASQVPVTVQASGQFQSLSVSDGQTVSQGQELMRYADDSKQSEIDEQANENTASQSKLTNLNNLLTSLNQQLARPRRPATARRSPASSPRSPTPRTASPTPRQPSSPAKAS